jgi:hypothetical protein
MNGFCAPEPGFKRCSGVTDRVGYGCIVLGDDIKVHCR